MWWVVPILRILLYTASLSQLINSHGNISSPLLKSNKIIIRLTYWYIKHYYISIGKSNKGICRLVHYWVLPPLLSSRPQQALLNFLNQSNCDHSISPRFALTHLTFALEMSSYDRQSFLTFFFYLHIYYIIFFIIFQISNTNCG